MSASSSASKRVVAFQARAGEELEPVVFIRIVRGADDDAGATVESPGEERDGGSRDDAKQRHVHAHGGDSGRDRRFQHRAGLPRVATDDHRPTRHAELHGDRAAESFRPGGGEVAFAGAAADAVGSEKTHVTAWRWG